MSKTMKWVKDGPRSWRLMDGNGCRAVVFRYAGKRHVDLWAWKVFLIDAGVEWSFRAAKSAATDAINEVKP